MVEPTETETLETLDHFVGVMREIAETAATDPDAIKRAPVTTPVGRLDEAAAARRPDLRYRFGEDDDRPARPSLNPSGDADRMSDGATAPYGRHRSERSGRCDVL